MKHILNKTVAYTLAVAMAIALLPAAYGADLAEAEPSDVPEVTAVEPVEATEADAAPVAEPICWRSGHFHSHHRRSL